MKRFLVVLTALVLLVGVATSARAEPIHDNFWVEVNGENQLLDGTGSGFGGGEWFYYESDWWNQWFYNDPPDPRRWKIIQYDIGVDPAYFQEPGWLEVALNWSTVDYQSGPNGPPPMDDLQIERWIIFSGDPPIGGERIEGEYIIDDFNPEWVSIDVRYLNSTEPESRVWVGGDIWHECVPEPSTLLLLGISAVGLVAYAWRLRSLS